MARGEQTLVLIRGQTPIAAFPTEIRSWDFPTAMAHFRDAGVNEPGDGIAFLHGRWTRRGAPIDGGWSFASPQQDALVALPHDTVAVTVFRARVPYATYAMRTKANPSTPEKHQRAIARKSLSMNAVGRSMVGLPLATAYRIIFGRDLVERLHELIENYPDVTPPNFVSWELETYQGADTTAKLRALLAEVEREGE